MRRRPPCSSRTVTFFPSTTLFLSTHERSTELLQGALRAGGKDVLTAPVEDDVLIAAIDRAGAALGLVPQREIFQPVERDLLEPDGERGRAITVFSTKGGAGKSFIDRKSTRLNSSH